MKVSQTVSYAIHAVLRLAERPEATPTTCSKLAAEGTMPTRFLLQILRSLAKQGILRSMRGSDGGFMLARRPDEISLLEVIEAVDGPMIAGIPSSDSFPRAARACLSDALHTVNDAIRRELQKVKLTELLETETSSETTPKTKSRGR